MRQWEKLGLTLLIISVLTIPFTSALTTYTPSTMEECMGDICNLILYGGTRHIFEDLQWKPIEEARSLKGWFLETYLTTDPSFDFLIIDYNYTDISFYMNFTGNPQDYPDFCSSTPGGYHCNFRIKIKWFENDAETELEYEHEWETDEGAITTTHEFRYYSPTTILDKTFKFGGNSTTIQLQDPNTEVLDDSYVSNGSAVQKDTNYDGGNLSIDGTDIFGSDRHWSWIKFDISQVPSSTIITDAILSLYVEGVTTNGWIDCYNSSNLTWKEEDITWNNQPSGSIGILQDNSARTTYYRFNVTDAVKYSYDESENNITFFLNASPGNDTDVNIGSKESTEVDKRPYMNITYGYSDIPVITISSPTNTTTDEDMWFNLSVLNQEGDSICYVDYSTGNITLTNSTGNWNYLNSTMETGGYTATFYCNNTAGWNSTSITFTIDATAPDMSVTSPVNDSYNLTTASYVWMNVSSHDTANVSCWVDFNGTNQSMSNTTGNFNIQQTISEGFYTATFYCNDTYNNWNSTSMAFTIDNTTPNITITYSSPAMVVDSSYAIQWNQNDATSGITESYVNYTSPTAVIYNDASSASGNGSRSSSRILDESGIWTILIYVRDNANNTHSDYTTIDVQSSTTVIGSGGGGGGTSYGDVIYNITNITAILDPLSTITQEDIENLPITQIESFFITPSLFGFSPIQMLLFISAGYYIYTRKGKMTQRDYLIVGAVVIFGIIITLGSTEVITTTDSGTLAVNGWTANVYSGIESSLDSFHSLINQTGANI